MLFKNNIYFCKQNMIIMKKLFILLGLTLTACSPTTGYRHQLDNIEAVIEEKPDSAWMMLEDIPASLIENGEERAWYNLLATEAAYKLYQPFTNDSMISYSIQYYKQKNNKSRLATAYYYKGAINYDELKNKETAVQYLKMAEDLAQNSGEELLKNKIYDKLSFINFASRDFNTAIFYSKLFLNSSIELEDPVLVARAYDKLSNNFSFLGKKDSANYFMKAAMKYADKCDSMSRANIYANYANNLIKGNRYSEAKNYLEIAVTLKPKANEFIMLGIIAKHEGDTLKARSNWEKAITFNESRFTITAYKHLANMYIENGEYLQALWMGTKADSVNLAYQEQIRTSELAQIQRRYDKTIVERALTERKNIWLTVAITALTILVVALLLLLRYQKRVKDYKVTLQEKENQISNNIRQINLAKQKIEVLLSAGQDFEKEVDQLKSRITRLTEDTANQLGRGKKIFETVQKGERIYDFSKVKEQNLIDYYAFTFADEFSKIVNPYHSLTMRLTTFLILQQIGLDDKTIQTVLSVAESTVRNYRYRLSALSCV